VSTRVACGPRLSPGARRRRPTRPPRRATFRPHAHPRGARRPPLARADRGHRRPPSSALRSP
jgi:hypothetical protein